MTDIERWRRRPGPRTRAWPLVCVALGVVFILAALVCLFSARCTLCVSLLTRKVRNRAERKLLSK